VVTAALGAAAFGLFGNGSKPSYWVLVIIPFVCAYIDLFKYQYELRIFVIAQFLREHRGDTGILQKYELRCHADRQKFSLGRLADITCSLGASIISAAFYMLLSTDALASRIGAGAAWLVGVIMIVAVRLYFGHEWRMLEQEKGRSQAMAA
jgi:hypothetical protein